MTDADCARVRADPDFIALERERSRLGWTLAIVMLVIYFGFVGLVAFDPALMGTPGLRHPDTGLPAGAGRDPVSAILLTGIYVLARQRQRSTR